MNTDCSKCKTPMRPVSTRVFPGVSFTLTSYRCHQCGHCNNLKRRKGWAQANEKAEQK